MCLYGEGAGCKVVVGRGSGGRPCHGLRSRSAWKNEKDFELKTIEPHFRREINRKPVNCRRFMQVAGCRSASQC
jgi:hypothetical protein